MKKIEWLVEKSKILSHTNYVNTVLACSYYDLAFFAKYFFTEIFEDDEDDTQMLIRGHAADPFNWMHEEFFRTFEPKQKQRHRLIIAPRGSSKTTLIVIIDLLHRVAFGNEPFTVILSSTSPLAILKGADIHTEVSLGNKLPNYFNLSISKVEKSKQKFQVHSCYGKSTIFSQGFYSQIRGMKKNYERPTYIIYDDIIHGQRVFSKTQREKDMRQFMTDIKNAAQPNTSHCIVGTIIHKEDILCSLFNDPSWEAYLYRSIIKWPDRMDLWEKWKDKYYDLNIPKNKRKDAADKYYEENKAEMNKGAKVLWPEREPLHYLMQERLKIGKRAFNAEKQNIPFLSGEALFKTTYWFELEEEIDGRDTIYYIKMCNDDLFKHRIRIDHGRFDKYYALDPATGERKKSGSGRVLSQSARIIGYKDRDSGRLFIERAVLDRASHSAIIQEMMEWHLQHQFELIGVEKNLYQDLYFDWIEQARREMEDKQRHPFPLPIKPVWAKEKKEDRIYSLEPAVSAGMIVFNKTIAQSFITQLEDYPHTELNDGLDALELLAKVSNSKNTMTIF